MLYDPGKTAVAVVAATVLFAGIVTSVSLFILNVKKKGKERPRPHRIQLLLGVAIGLGVPIMIFVYTLFFSPVSKLGAP